MAWLAGWAKRVKLTIDHGDIDAEQTWHHLRVHLSASSGHSSRDVSCVFDELESNDNRKKIALTKADGTTQLYCEIEKWDHASEQAELWVSRDGWVWSPDVDTDLYLYYDKTKADNTDYIGDKGLAGRDGPRENVWDTNFKMVQHLNDETTSTVTDSTRNNNDGTKGAAGQPTEVSGKIADAQDFLPANTEHVSCADAPSLDLTRDTIEAWVKPAGWAAVRSQIVYKNGNYAFAVASYRKLMVYTYGTTPTGWLVSTVTIPEDDWTYAVETYDQSNLRIYINDAENISDERTGPLNTTDLVLMIGTAGDPTDNPTQAQCFEGIIDEVRISNIARTAAWLKASYESDRDHLLDFGGEEEAPSNSPAIRSANMGAKMIAGKLI